MEISPGARLSISSGASISVMGRVFSGDGVVDGKKVDPGKHSVAGSKMVVTYDRWEGIIIPKFQVEVRDFCRKAVKSIFDLNNHFVGKFDLR
jgi:hypothetical protein